MSLLRLLTAGKSLVGLKDQQLRYMTRGVSLPKFGSKKNPFRATTKAEAAVPAESTRASGVSAPQAPLSVTGAGGQPRDASDFVKTGSRNAVADSEARTPSYAAAKVDRYHAPNPGTGGSNGSAPSAEGYFTLTKLLFWQRTKTERQGQPQHDKPMLQGQLSLEGVKVVRNDLSDTDLEIVPVKPAVTAPPAAHTSSKIEKAPSPENAWGRMTARIFGAGKV